MKKALWLAISVVMAVSLLITACGKPASTPTSPSAPAPGVPQAPTPPSPPSAPNSTVPAVPTPAAPAAQKLQTGAAASDVPKYGGTFVTRIASDPTAWDPWYGGSIYGMSYETLGQQNWMEVPPQTWDFKSRFTPVKYDAGKLVESWETSDYQTITFHVRKNIHFQNIPPVNGREMTAADVEFSFDRLMGLGYGYTKPTPFVSVVNHAPILSVNATDKYTVVFKLKAASLSWLINALDDHFMNSIMPQEAIKQWGDMNKWDRTIGTGPFIIKDYVPGSVITWVRNPNYWAHDERNPENQLPYVDGVSFLIIPDISTATAALRTGKIDRLISLARDDAASLLKTNPELQQVDLPGSANPALYMQVDKPPFSDIRVRQALQMSVDLETLAKTYYAGLYPGKPVGLVGLQGYYVPFDEWPLEVKDSYLYNPEKAKQLLKEAGYPNGFKTEIALASTNVDLLSIIKDYFSRIGVDMALNVKDPGALTSYVAAGLAQMSVGFDFDNRPPISALSYRASTHPVAFPATHINDPVFDAMYQKADATVDAAEQARLIREADLYVTKHQWTVNLVPVKSFTIYQPWIRRYPPTQEVTVGQKMARLWIDLDLKKSMRR